MPKDGQFTAKTSKLSVIEALIEHGALSRSDLAERIGLSRSALTELSRELIENRLIRETSVVHDGQRQGRPSVLLALNEYRGYVLGVSIQGHVAQTALCDVYGNVLEERSIRMSPEPEATAKAIKSGLRELLQSASLQKREVLGIGLAISGFVDRGSGICVRSNELGWSDVRIGEIVKRITGVPTYVENDANAVAMGEKLFGDAKKLNNFTIVTLGDSIGAGHFVGGHLYPGASGGAGEIGHYTMQPNGLPCRCGKAGCLDTISGATAMIELARSRSLKVTSVQNLEHLAAGGNPRATEILRQAGQMAGLAVSYVVQTNNPEMVLFAFTEDIAGGLFLTTIRQAIENNILPRFLPTTQLLFQRVTKAFWAKGAASIAAHEFFRERVSS